MHPCLSVHLQGDWCVQSPSGEKTWFKPAKPAVSCLWYCICCMCSKLPGCLPFSARLDSLVDDLRWDIDYSLNSACLLTTYLTLTLLNLAWLVPGLSFLHVCSLLACPGLVARYYSIVYKSWGQPSTGRPVCLMGKGASIGEQHRSQL